MEAASGLPAGESPEPMGELHHMERWETGPETLPMAQPGQSEEGTLLPARQSNVRHLTAFRLSEGRSGGKCFSFITVLIHSTGEGFLRCR